VSPFVVAKNDREPVELAVQVFSAPLIRRGRDATMPWPPMYIDTCICIYAFYQPGKIGDGFFLGLQQFLCFFRDQANFSTYLCCVPCHILSPRDGRMTFTDFLADAQQFRESGEILLG